MWQWRDRLWAFSGGLTPARPAFFKIDSVRKMPRELAGVFCTGGDPGAVVPPSSSTTQDKPFFWRRGRSETRQDRPFPCPQHLSGGVLPSQVPAVHDLSVQSLAGGAGMLRCQYAVRFAKNHSSSVCISTSTDTKAKGRWYGYYLRLYHHD